MIQFLSVVLFAPLLGAGGISGERECTSCGEVAVFRERKAVKSFGLYMIDVFDYYAYWKLFDGLSDAAFHGKNRKYALGDTPEQKFMGNYSDGRPFEELVIWKGDAKIDPDATPYLPLYDRNGRLNKAAEGKEEEPKAEKKKEQPGQTPGKKEDEEDGF